MTASVIILVLLSALFHAFWNYLSKVSYSPQLFLAWVAIVNIAISIAVFLIDGLGTENSRYWSSSKTVL